MFSSLTLISQKKVVSEDSIIKKWIRASINLEAHPNFLVSKVWASWRKGQAPPDKNVRIKFQENYRRKTSRATCIFLLYKNKHYLITARHFLVDENAISKNWVHERFFLGPNASDELNKKPIDTLPQIEYFDGHLGGKNPKYIISDEKIDIGIIALDDIPRMGRQFVAILYERGYRPILYQDIGENIILPKNAKLITIGFPSEISEIAKLRKNSDTSIKNWKSAYRTIPVISKGNVKQFNDKDYYFTADIFSFHGNSGGPVIYKNKLVGINCAIGGPLTSTTDEQLNYYLEERGYFSKAKNVVFYLKELEKRFPPNNSPYVVMKNYRDSLTGIISGGTIIVQ